MQVRIKSESDGTVLVQRQGESPAADAIRMELRQVTTLLQDAGGTVDQARVEEARERLLRLTAQLQAENEAPSEAALAAAVAEPGREAIVTVPPHFVGGDIQKGEQYVATLLIGALAVTAVLFPLMRAFGRILERRAAPPQRLDGETAAHLAGMERAIEAVAIEVERIAEGQRYATKLLSEREKVGDMGR